MKQLRGSPLPQKLLTFGRLLIICMMICLSYSGLTMTMTAHAAGKKDIVSHKPTVITQQDRVENVVVIGNDAEIDGTVDDTVVVINGNIHLGANAHVGLLIGIGGTLTKEPGARIVEMYMVSLGSRFQNSLAVGTAILFAASTVRLMASVGLVVIPALLTFLLHGWLPKPLTYLENSARRMGMIGLLATVCIAALVIVLAFTVVGIPVAVVLGLLLVGLGVLGLAVVSVWVGHLAASGIVPEKPVWIYGWIGAIFIMAFSNIPLIGPLLLFMVSLIGIGTVTMLLWDMIFSKRLQNR